MLLKVTRLTATNAPQVVLGLLACCAWYALPVVNVAPNRLLSGQPVYFLFPLLSSHSISPKGLDVYGLSAVLSALLLVALLALVFLAFVYPNNFQRRLTLALSYFLPPLVLWIAALHPHSTALTGMAISDADTPLIRTALGSGFWLVGGLGALLAADVLRQWACPPWARSLAALTLTLILWGMLGSGLCDGLSIMKEYAAQADSFMPAVWRHIEIVSVAMTFTLASGLPLGWAAHHDRRVGQVLFPILNIAQTIPSIALFGLMMAPLAFVAERVPALGRAGISGVGLVPAVLALTLYSLLPVVRGTLTGLAQVPSEATQAARGMGMSRWQTGVMVELPLALPVVLGGVRTATVQCVGLAAVTALIGAGGLGSIMFEGLFSSAQDLVLLGVVPLVMLGALADTVFKGLTALSQSQSGNAGDAAATTEPRSAHD